MRIYAIGDIHGQNAKLREAHQLIAEDRLMCGDKHAPVVHLGDYIDRGPDSRGVLQTLIKGEQWDRPWIFLKGNHEAIMDSLLGGDPTLGQGFSARGWITGAGGRETLESYGIRPSRLMSESALRKAMEAGVPAEHQSFISDLPSFYETPDLIFVHAGIQPGVPIDEQMDLDLLWIRNAFLNDPRDHGKIIVHGHTPVAEATHYGNRINLDTGAGYGHALTTVVFEGRDVWLLTPRGRAALKREVIQAR